MSICSTRELLDAIKKMMEEDFAPNGSYHVYKLDGNGKTSLVVHLLYNTPKQDTEDSKN